SVLLESQHFLDLLIEFGLLERTPLNFVEAGGIHKIFGAEHPAKLAHVQFSDQDLSVAFQDVTHIGGKGVEVAKVQMTDLAALGALRFHGLRDGAVGGTPGNDEEVAFGIAGRQHVGNVLNDGIDFRGTNANHVLVVQRLVVDVAAYVLFFQAANTVLEAFGARNGPGTGECVGIPLVGHEALWIRSELYGDFRNFFFFRDSPRLSSVGQITVRQNDYRHHVLQGDAAGLNGNPEAIARSRGREHGDRGFGVAAEHGLQ